MGKLFVCYRRRGSPAHTYRLVDELQRQFGDENVFVDVESIAPGMPFEDAIRQALERSSVMLVMMGPRWLSAEHKDGRRRIDVEDDSIRLEVELGLRSNARVIPVLIEGAEMPEADELPEAIAGLSQLQAVALADDKSHWDFDVARLIERIRRIDPSLPRASSDREGSVPGSVFRRWAGPVAGVLALLLVVVGLTYNGVLSPPTDTGTALQPIPPPVASLAPLVSETPAEKGSSAALASLAPSPSEAAPPKEPGAPSEPEPSAALAPPLEPRVTAAAPPRHTPTRRPRATAAKKPASRPRSGKSGTVLARRPKAVSRPRVVEPKPAVSPRRPLSVLLVAWGMPDDQGRANAAAVRAYSRRLTDLMATSVESAVAGPATFERHFPDRGMARKLEFDGAGHPLLKALCEKSRVDLVFFTRVEEAEYLGIGAGFAYWREPYLSLFDCKRERNTTARVRAEEKRGEPFVYADALDRQLRRFIRGAGLS